MVKLTTWMPMFASSAAVSRCTLWANASGFAWIVSKGIVLITPRRWPCIIWCAISFIWSADLLRNISAAVAIE